MKFFENFNLKDYNSYCLTAYCARAYFPENENDLLELFSKKERTKKIILGNGNNILLSKNWYKEHFVIFKGNFNHINIDNHIVTAETGATLLSLSKIALKHKLQGFETFYDIPGSVGGAVVMNAGAGGKEIKDLVIKVRYLDLTDVKIKEIFNEDIGFEYRNSFFQRHPDKILIRVWFRLFDGEFSVIKAKMIESKNIRWSKQPRDYPNCGSVFKRPNGRFVGPMLDELGLKGFTIGGAKISEKHSGFIINTGTATGNEILSLIKIAQSRVKEKFGIELEVEQRII